MKARLFMTIVLLLVVWDVSSDEAPVAVLSIQDNVDLVLSADRNSVSSVGTSTSDETALSDSDLERLIRSGRALREWDVRVQNEKRSIVGGMIVLVVVVAFVAVIFIALHLYLRSKVPD